MVGVVCDYAIEGEHPRYLYCEEIPAALLTCGGGLTPLVEKTRLFPLSLPRELDVPRLLLRLLAESYLPFPCGNALVRVMRFRTEGDPLLACGGALVLLAVLPLLPLGELALPEKSTVCAERHGYPGKNFQSQLHIRARRRREAEGESNWHIGEHVLY